MSWIEHKDEFQTPPDVAAYMVSLLHYNVRHVFEPTPGNGQIVQAIEAVGLEAFTPKSGDFFDIPTERIGFDSIVMNPPFSAKYTNLENAPAGLDLSGTKCGSYILDQCMKMSDNVIALMPNWELYDSDVRLRKFKSFGLISVTALPRKTFNYARVQTCILQLQKGYTGHTEFKVYDLLQQ